MIKKLDKFTQDDRTIIADPPLPFKVRKIGGHWIATCLEYDIVANSTTKKGLVSEIAEAVFFTVDAYESSGHREMADKLNARLREA